MSYIIFRDPQKALKKAAFEPEKKLFQETAIDA